MGRFRRKGGEGGYLRATNRSSYRVDLKVREKNRVDDIGIEDIQGSMEPGSRLPVEGKQPFEDEDGNSDPEAVYCYIEGDVRNRLQRDGYIVLEAQVEGGSPSGLRLTVDHNSWGMEDTSPDKDSPVSLIADVTEEEDMWKIELRIYNNYDTKCWMALLEDSIKDLPLTQVGIPGTHDSGTYCFDKEKGASPDSDLTKTIQDKLPGRVLGAVSDVILSQVFGRLCQCQSKTFKEQLDGGIRYLDLRIAYHESGEFYTCHGVYCANMKDVMDQIKSFLDENPRVRHVVCHQCVFYFTGPTHRFGFALFSLRVGNLDS